MAGVLLVGESCWLVYALSRDGLCMAGVLMVGNCSWLVSLWLQMVDGWFPDGWIWFLTVILTVKDGSWLVS
jgi:hypothetical protein